VSSHVPVDDATKELSDADVDAVIDEVLAMPDLTVEDANAPPSAPSGPPPGVSRPIGDDAKDEFKPSSASKPEVYSNLSVREEPQTDADDLASRFAALKKGP
jgi:hypothetical protein